MLDQLANGLQALPLLSSWNRDKLSCPTFNLSTRAMSSGPMLVDSKHSTHWTISPVFLIF